MRRNAPIEHEVHALIRERWSPRAFADQLVPASMLRRLFEAARWAPSCFNEQPWRLMVAGREAPAEFDRILACLGEANQVWAKRASVLVIAVAACKFAHNQKPNRHAAHDVGQAIAWLTVQATAMGLVVHQMAGFDPEKAKVTLGVPDGFEALTALAIGYADEPDTLPEALATRELAPRTRRPQAAFVFGTTWDAPLRLDGESEIDHVLSFWFGEPDVDGLAPPDRAERWWKKDPAFDAQIREAFAEEHAAILAGEREAWKASARGRLAYLIVLDQLSRNMFRDTAQMFASDPLAERVAREGIELGMDRALRGDLRAFWYLPLMHSERLEVQEQCVQQFREFHAEAEGPLRNRIANNLAFAERHRDIVIRWGRFPHRNVLLGRESTPEERAFLRESGSSF
ncbi:MAG: DUF924 family protein [Polyangiaceae bacterium]|jgi:uncharacterized protein (DUF924 family)/nitroreductase|nr:DUF924 family protein [Polyangiaceae bacterium]